MNERRPSAPLRLVGPADLDSLDPAVSRLPTTAQLARLHARQLFTYPPQPDLRDFRAISPVPDLAVDIPSIYNAGVGASHRSYTVHLRRGVFWDTSPPREVTAHDFVRAFKRFANPVVPCPALSYFTSTIRGMEQYCQAFAAAVDHPATAESLAAFQYAHEIPGVRAVDDWTLLFELSRPAPDFLWMLAMPCVSPVPAEYDAFLPDSQELAGQLRATGPYRLHAYRPGRSIQLVPNPVWRQESDPIRRQQLAGVQVRIQAATSQEVGAELGAGTADLPWGADVARADAACGDPAQHGSGLGHALDPYLVFNLRGPRADGTLGQVAVRRAVACAIDKAAVASIVTQLAPESPVRVANTVVPPGNDCHQDGYPAIDEHGDPERARRLLEAARAAGTRLTLVHLDSAVPTSVAAACATDLAKVGITVDTVPLSPRDYYRRLGDPGTTGGGRWDLAVAARAPDWHYQNARVFLQPMFQSAPHPSPVNYGGYRNPAVNRLIEAALSSFQPGQAAQAWHEVERRVLADAAIVPILFRAPPPPQCHAARVRDAITMPSLGFTVDLATVRVSDPAPDGQSDD